jgi:hypothetical protein
LHSLGFTGLNFYFQAVQQIFFQHLGVQIADILVENEKDYPEIYIHSFSAGACMWGVVHRMMKNASSIKLLKF